MNTEPYRITALPKSKSKNVREDGTPYAETMFWSNPQKDSEGRDFLTTDFIIDGRKFSFYGYPTKTGSIPWKVSTPKESKLKDLGQMTTAKV